MANRRPLQIERDEPEPLSDRAIDNLRYIRETMERAGTFTALSGRGIALTGIIAFLASAIAGPTLGSPRWLGTWMGAAASAMLVSAAFTLRKADASAVRISGALGRKRPGDGEPDAGGRAGDQSELGAELQIHGASSSGHGGVRA